ncbi:MAG: hypothetical protein ACHP9T_16695 [Caulobacterales bacterium]|jgi:hypothetical protein
MNDIAYQFVTFAAIYCGVLTAVGFYASHQHRKYAAMAEAEREAARQAGS